jgi:hypothetical protein
MFSPDNLSFRHPRDSKLRHMSNVLERMFSGFCLICCEDVSGFSDFRGSCAICSLPTNCKSCEPNTCVKCMKNICDDCTLLCDTCRVDLNEFVVVCVRCIDKEHFCMKCNGDNSLCCDLRHPPVLVDVGDLEPWTVCRECIENSNDYDTWLLTLRESERTRNAEKENSDAVFRIHKSRVGRTSKVIEVTHPKDAALNRIQYLLDQKVFSMKGCSTCPMTLTKFSDLTGECYICTCPTQCIRCKPQVCKFCDLPVCIWCSKSCQWCKRNGWLARVCSRCFELRHWCFGCDSTRGYMCPRHPLVDGLCNHCQMFEVTDEDRARSLEQFKKFKSL